MKSMAAKFGMLAVLAGVLSGCGGGYVAYRAPMPPPRPYGVGMVGRPPGPGYVWVDGYHDWRGRGYVWVPGDWRRPPRARAVWIPGRFEQRGRRNVWISGRWR